MNEGAKPERDDARARAVRIKERALALGFHKVGIARAEPLLAERARLEDWVRRGFHATMRWMARDAERRTDPHQLLPSARSVIATALNYYTPHEHAADPTRGKISRYAWGDDYHLVIEEKLRALLSWIQNEWPGTQGKTCVDAQPAMDKAWAVRAGLGWIGKHSNLITREYGSWVFLGELILDLELEPDPPFAEDHCGTCTLCLEACPTRAIIEPRVVDAGRCISYATIELRSEEIPAEIACNLEGWLFGCDICQDVCPWNRFEQPTDEARFAPRGGQTALPLTEIVEMEHETYVEKFRHSAIKRAKLSGLKRTARALLAHNEQRDERRDES
ncbi:MAG: tRNA epoxyqueuosine(34) reductase QueG [Pyrinomonas sp.]|uniref:tRNA epoxyqueuosine(34) reductase QueG n=1 Tax=Pyrinomonas sp. TaxID=2080306 RepID=UPI0033212DAA